VGCEAILKKDVEDVETCGSYLFGEMDEFVERSGESPGGRDYEEGISGFI